MLRRDDGNLSWNERRKLLIAPSLKYCHGSELPGWVVASVTSRCSIVMEWENATTHSGDEAAPIFAALLEQLLDRPPRASDTRHELILVFDPSEWSGEDIDGVIASSAPALHEHVDIRKLARPGLRYYEFKNAGAEIARGDILVFLDSDAIPEKGWLATLLEPFDDPRTMAVNGHTYLGHTDFMSRVFALVWVFPLRDDGSHEIHRRSLNANNCAFRRVWFAGHSFPYHPGFKVSCSLLAAQMRHDGVELVRAAAYVCHKPLEGRRFLLWRAAVAGRDDDSRYVTLRSSRRGARLARAASRWINSSSRSFRRIVTRHGAVGMPAYEVPAAIAVAWLYYGAAFLSQVASALSRPRSEPEHVPSFVARRW
jgi:glycosyltransferase involved in cell wall biosynthesis